VNVNCFIICCDVFLTITSALCRFLAEKQKKDKKDKKTFFDEEG